MKRRTQQYVFVLLIVLLTACSSSSKEYELADITRLFEDAELHLKPQAENSYPYVRNVAPAIYELLDDSIYIYVFDSADELVAATEGLQVEELFNASPYVYPWNNILILYLPHSPADVNFEKQIRDLIHAA